MYKTASTGVQAERLWSRHVQMSQFGRICDGGVNRQALTREEVDARGQLLGWARERGFRVAVDAIGNLFITRAGREPNLSSIMTGSHLDTQPAAGNFDGAYGVLAGFEVLEALSDLGITTRRSVQTTVWTNEEGVRFAPGLMGSGVFTGSLALTQMLQSRAPDGVSVAEALTGLERILRPGDERLQHVPAPHTYIEAHIEQGPVLEERGVAVGVVTGIQGIRLYEVEVTGEEGHAGTVPVGARKDALRAAVRLSNSLYAEFADPGEETRFTIGRFTVAPGGRSTIPGRVEFSIDLRHPELSVLEIAERKTIDTIDECNGRPCAASVTRVLARKPTYFAPHVIELISAESRRLELPHLHLPSGAGHDAMMLSDACPTGMIFVPCKEGISHSVRESARKEDLAAGARVLANVLQKLAMQ
jgi:beta-ureidopropionase / N-carbamoyl-L-amino-acid hydrolase